MNAQTIRENTAKAIARAMSERHEVRWQDCLPEADAAIAVILQTILDIPDDDFERGVRAFISLLFPKEKA